MHEVSLCESMVEMLQEKAAIEHFERVETIRLQVGKLSCVQPEALRFAFDAVASNSVAEGARLEIDEIEGLGWCEQCQCESVIRQRYDACPQCQACPLEIRAGEEMRIESIEVV